MVKTINQFLEVIITITLKAKSMEFVIIHSIKAIMATMAIVVISSLMAKSFVVKLRWSSYLSEAENHLIFPLHANVDVIGFFIVVLILVKKASSIVEEVVGLFLMRYHLCCSEYSQANSSDIKSLTYPLNFPFFSLFATANLSSTQTALSSPDFHEIIQEIHPFQLFDSFHCYRMG